MENQQNRDQEGFSGPTFGSNIWGWKFARFGLFLVVFFLSLVLYRRYTLGVPIWAAPEAQTELINSDTLR